MKEKGKIIAVLEIASASIGGALIEQNKNGRPKIISLHRSAVNFLFDVSLDAFWRCTQASLKEVLKLLRKDYPAGVNASLGVLSSPWFFPQTKIIDIRREKPVKVTKGIFENLMKMEEENFCALAKTQLKKEPEFIEHEIIKMELNGYETKSPLGKTAKTVRIHAYLSAGMKEINRKIEDQFLQDFGGPKLSFRTFPFVVFQILNELSLNEEELFLIDIGGEISDLILVRKNSLEKIISFPYGRNFLLRKISSAFNTFPEEASSILGSYLKEHRHEEEAEKISKIIEETKKEWGDSFETAVKNLFESLPAGGPLPQNLYLLGDEAVASELVKSAGEERFSRFTVLGKPFNIKKISFEETDTFLMMESLFANKFL